MQFFQGYEIVHLLEVPPYNYMLPLLFSYFIFKLLLVVTARDSLRLRPYLVYELETGAVYPVTKASKLEVVYLNNVLTGRRRRRFRT